MNNDFIEKPIGALYARFLPAAIISMLISSVASLIDTVVVSYFMGPVALSAVNICMPIYSILIAVSLLIVGGAGTIFSHHLGKGDLESAHKIYTLAIVILIIIGAAYSLFGLLNTGAVVRFLGANDSVFTMSKDYAKVLFAFALIQTLFPFLQTFVRIDLEPGLDIIAIVLCAITNMILDILFVGPFLTPEGFGTRGAAFATCIAYCLAFLILATHFIKKKNTLHFRKGFFHMKDVGNILITGLPASITLFGTAITMTVFNNFIIVRGETYGAGIGELYVSVYSVIVQVMTISMAVYVGIGQCAQPILAANYAAQKTQRLREAFHKGLIIEIASNLALTVIFFIIAAQIASIFSMDKGAYDMTSTAILAIRIYALSLVFSGANQIILYLLQTTENVRQSSIISFLSGTLLPIVGLYLLAGCLMKGNPDGIGVWYSFLFAQGLTLVYSIFAYLKNKHKIFPSAAAK